MAMREPELKIEHTIPYRSYVEEETLKDEKSAIFYKSWIMVGHTSQVAEIGDYFTFDLAGEPLIISRNKNNELSAMFNICPHRGTRVEQKGAGNKKIFQCMYHGWTFHLDGQLHRAPNFGGTCHVEGRSCLRQVQITAYKGLIFVNLDPSAKPLAEIYGDFHAELDKYDFLPFLKQVISTTHVIQANWKAIIDNYLECDHCQLNHPGLSKTFNMRDYHIEPYANYTRQYSELKKADQKKQAYFYWMWPNLMVSIYPQGYGNMTTSQIIPIAPDQTLAIYNYYFISDAVSDEQQELIDFVDQVRQEDFELVELLQTGFHTQAFSSGIYSPKENGLKYFHDRYKLAMG